MCIVLKISADAKKRSNQPKIILKVTNFCDKIYMQILYADIHVSIRLLLRSVPGSGRLTLGEPAEKEAYFDCLSA